VIGVLLVLYVVVALVRVFVMPDRIVLVVKAATLVPAKPEGRSGALGFDSELGEAALPAHRDPATPAPTETVAFPPGGCAGLELVPAPLALKLIPARWPPRRSEGCTLTFTRVSPSTPKPTIEELTPEETRVVPLLASDSSKPPVHVLKRIKLDAVQYRRWIRSENSPSGDSRSALPEPVESAGPEIVTVEGRDLRLDSAAVQWVDNRRVLVLDVSADALTAIRVGDEDQTRCWRWSKFRAALLHFKLPGQVAGALTIVEDLCGLGRLGQRS
jgi:hypothetical protein